MPPIWTDEIEEEYQQYKELGERQERARENYNTEVEKIQECLVSRCWRCIKTNIDCDEEMPCHQCITDGMGEDCEYPDRAEKLPAFFDFVTTEEHIDLVDLATDWKNEANDHLNVVGGTT